MRRLVLAAAAQREDSHAGSGDPTNALQIRKKKGFGMYGMSFGGLPRSDPPPGEVLQQGGAATLRGLVGRAGE